MRCDIYSCKHQDSFFKDNCGAAGARLCVTGKFPKDASKKGDKNAADSPPLTTLDNEKDKQ